ncbi:hypothetical protein CALCODRAFT_558224 [Calocera cornea HHB12733]|uniref:NACHT domain-containing protein n=1 Tax=Calocera cornea HHB12733 TaxID=1353952 RepID=A0A165D6H8_9BASI|nr:hypothetical protein CALCODRAFT_558224 [Calocera cornea HHB12733]
MRSLWGTALSKRKVAELKKRIVEEAFPRLVRACQAIVGILDIVDETEKERARLKATLKFITERWMDWQKIVEKHADTANSGKGRFLDRVAESLDELSMQLEITHQALGWDVPTAANLSSSMSAVAIQKGLDNDRVAQLDKALSTALSRFEGREKLPVGSTSTDAVNLKPGRLLPLPPQVLVGRDSVIESFTSSLVNGEKPAAVIFLGAGGIGKTAAALAVLHSESVQRKFGGRRFFLPCHDECRPVTPTAIIAALASQLGFLHSERKGMFNEVTRFLRSTGGPNLLVLDGFELVWDTDSKLVIEELLRSIMAFSPTSLLVTMRGSDFPAGIQWETPRLSHLEPLSRPDSRILYLSMNAIEDPQLDTLLEAMDGWPLAIELIALAGNGMLTPTQLLQRYTLLKTKLLNRHPPTHATSVELSIEMSLNSGVVQRQPMAQVLLVLLSKFPSGTLIHLLETIFRRMGGEVYLAEEALRKVSLIYLRGSRLHILAPIRLYLSNTQANPDHWTNVQQHYLSASLYKPLPSEEGYFPQGCDPLRSTSSGNSVVEKRTTTKVYLDLGYSP